MISNETSMKVIYDGKINLQRLVAIIYIYMLPFRMILQLSNLFVFFKGAAYYFDIVFHIIGLSLLLIRKKRVPKEEKKLLNLIRNIVIIFSIISIVMAFITQISKGSYAGETAFSGIVGMFIYFWQYYLIVYYDFFVFKMLSSKNILKILNRLCLFLLILGYVQIICLNSNKIKLLFTKLDIFGVLFPADNMWKLSLTTLEGASAGGLICCFVLPILYSQILMKKNYFQVLQIFLWIPVVYFTKSSTAYILYVSTTITFVFFYIKNIKKFFMIVALAFLVFFLLFIFKNSLPSEFQDGINYLLFEKIADKSNGSTVSRMIPLYMNWNSFKSSPIFGVGNGLQGYFFNDVSSWMLNVPGSDIRSFYKIASTTIANGGCFFLGVISGYGLVGTCFVIYYVIKSNKLLKIKKDELDCFYYMYYIAAFSIIIFGFQGDFCGLYYIWFILSIPFMTKNK